MFQKGGVGLGGGPLMMVKDSLFLLISNALGRGCVGLGRGPSKDDEGFFVSVNLFLPGGGPTDYFITMFLLLSNER